MKTYLIPSKYRHSVIEYFDDLVAKKQVNEFFIGSIDPDSNHFSLSYQIAEGYLDIAIPHFHPFYADKQLELRELEAFNSIKQLTDALDKIATNNSVWQLEEAKKILEEFITIDLSLVDFEDDGRFQVEASLEWLS